MVGIQFQVEEPPAEQSGQLPAENVEVTAHTPVSGDVLKMVLLLVAVYIIATQM